MRSCEFCRSEIPDNASFCGICGREVRNSPQRVRGDVHSVIPGSGNNVSVSGRSARKPYQFSSQSYQDQKQADIPTVAYTPRASEVPSTQQTPYFSPPATVNAGAQRYPSAQPQAPQYVGNPKPPKRGQA